MLQLQNLIGHYLSSGAYSGSGTATLIIVTYILSAGISVLSIAAAWKIYSKAGEPGWASIIPFYNFYVLFKITWGKGSKFWLLLIPIYNVVLIIQTYVKLAKAFGRGGGFAVGLLFLQPIFFMILGFGRAGYLGVPGNAVPAYTPGGYQQYPPQQYTQSQPPQYRSLTPQYSSQQPQYASPPPQQAFCRNCGQRINPGEKFCQNCGAPQYAPSQPPQYAQQQAFCQNCGQRVNPGKKFCRYCGAPLVRQPGQAYSAPQQAARQKAEAMPQRPVYPPAQPQYYPQYTQQQQPKGHGGIIFLNILLASVCAALLIIGIIIIPGNIKNARIPIQVFEEFPPDEEISEQMRILEAGGSLFQQMPEGYVRPEHHEIAEWFYIDPDSDD